MYDHKHIVAFGGLRTRPGEMSPVIDYILSLPQEILHLPQKPRPRICMIPTATGDSPASLLAFYNRVPGAWAARSHLALFDRTERDIRTFLLNQDIILVGGGNTANMLAVWRVHGVDEILREAWDSGILLCGGSAGSLCWFECGTTDSFDLNELQPIHDGLGFLPGSHCPPLRWRRAAPSPIPPTDIRGLSQRLCHRRGRSNPLCGHRGRQGGHRTPRSHRL